ncbi:hypothetical protein D9615_009569 [Tricholomella constricta]|uniref:Ankyrin repeat protein n=1 Tax=Tricholomella constricta TaxID=117010 RepID=A0A8H5GV88_9AGAR|nr:hypothetical protein D9615_009569 [Tricholomella constricta]
MQVVSSYLTITSTISSPSSTLPKPTGPLHLHPHVSTNLSTNPIQLNRPGTLQLPTVSSTSYRISYPAVRPPIPSPSTLPETTPGGDVNITDGDGDTPLYTVENIDTARLLVDHGATIDRRNNEGVSPIEHLTEDFPHVASFLRTLVTPSSTSTTNGTAPPSQHQQNAASEQLTNALMASVEDIMQRATAEGRDPDEELRQAVSRTVLEGVVAGFQMTEDDDVPVESPAKRPRMDGGA